MIQILIKMYLFWKFDSFNYNYCTLGGCGNTHLESVIENIIGSVLFTTHCLLRLSDIIEVYIFFPKICELVYVKNFKNSSFDFKMKHPGYILHESLFPHMFGSV